MTFEAELGSVQWLIIKGPAGLVVRQCPAAPGSWDALADGQSTQKHRVVRSDRGAPTVDVG